MKFAFAILLMAICAVQNFSQENTIEKDFEKNKSNYKLEKYSEGEDATSGFDYLIYKYNDQIVKIREIWSSSAVTTFRIADFYYKDGNLAAHVKYTFPKKHYKKAVKGQTVPLNEVEKLYLKDSKLTTWTEMGKTVSNTDPRWEKREKEAQNAAKDALENYEFLKEEN